MLLVMLCGFWVNDLLKLQPHFTLHAMCIDKRTKLLQMRILDVLPFVASLPLVCTSYSFSFVFAFSGIYHSHIIYFMADCFVDGDVHCNRYSMKDKLSILWLLLFVICEFISNGDKCTKHRSRSKVSRWPSIVCIHPFQTIKCIIVFYQISRLFHVELSHNFIESTLSTTWKSTMKKYLSSIFSLLCFFGFS